MNLSRVLTVATLSLGLAITSLAQTSATGVVWQSGFDSALNLNKYIIQLTNTGSTNIETLWYSWIPGQDYMGSRPSVFTEPSDFNAPIVTGGGSGDGFAIRWESANGGLAAGATQQFSFESASTIAQLGGPSSFHGGPNVGTSFVYSGEFSGTSDEFIVQTVPTPPTYAVMSMGVLGLLIRRKAKRNS